jgi:hypothetical protein
MLIHTQMKGARYVAPAHRWNRDYQRRIKPGARPIAILQPMGPVMFVFDVIDTEPMPGAAPLPAKIDRPFEVSHGQISSELPKTIANCMRDGISVTEREAGSQSAGSIQSTPPGAYLQVMTKRMPKPELVRVPRRYASVLNSNLSREARFATLVHELGHLYCGHLGTPNPQWWPDRRGLETKVEEFEAESVCYLICERAGLTNPSKEYLAGYLRDNEEIPAISFDRVMRATGLIETMARERLPLRKPHK